CTRSPRSSSMRTVSTAYRGIPAARWRMRSSVSSGTRRRVPTGARACSRPTALYELGSRERHHEDGEVPRPLQQVLDEVEQRAIRPLHVLEDHHDGQLLCESLEEQAPGGEQVLLVRRGSLLQAQEVREPGFDPPA